MVGRNLREHPAARNWEVLAPARGDLDLADRAAVCAYLELYRPELIIHAAGHVGGIEANRSDAVSFLVNNIDIGRNVIISALHAGVPALINLSSSCMYPRGIERPIRETDLLSGELEPTNEGYALAKIVTTKLCEYITQKFPELSYKTMVPCNLYGRHDNFDLEKGHLVPAVIAKIEEAIANEEKSVEIWGDGSARREFLYAGDLADAIWRAAEDPARLPQTMNIGLGVDHTVLEYYQSIKAITGWRGYFTHDLTRPVGMKRKLTDISLQKKWGWHARTTLEEGLKATISFYKEEMEKNGKAISPSY